MMREKIPQKDQYIFLNLKSTFWSPYWKTLYVVLSLLLYRMPPKFNREGEKRRQRTKWEKKDKKAFKFRAKKRNSEERDKKRIKICACQTHTHAITEESLEQVVWWVRTDNAEENFVSFPKNIHRRQANRKHSRNRGFLVKVQSRTDQADQVNDRTMTILTQTMRRVPGTFQLLTLRFKTISATLMLPSIHTTMPKRTMKKRKCMLISIAETFRSYAIPDIHHRKICFSYVRCVFEDARSCHVKEFL